MKQRETDITKAIFKELRAMNCFCWKHWGGPMSKRGVADILGVLPGGRFLAIEVKANGHKPTAHQEKFLEDVSKKGGVAFVARSVDEVREILTLGGYQAPQQQLFADMKG
jgi:hypothetical protein